MKWFWRLTHGMFNALSGCGLSVGEWAAIKAVRARTRWRGY